MFRLFIVVFLIGTTIQLYAAEYELENHARRYAGSIRDDGLRKVLAGKTTLEEVLRVTTEAAE